MTLEELQQDFQQQIQQLKQELEASITDQIVSYVPSGVNFKLASVNSLNPGHKHDANGLSMVATNVFGYDITKVGQIPQVVKAANFSKTNDAVMATITGMQWNVLAGKQYILKAKLILEAGATGGIQLGLNGTMTTTSLGWTLSVVGDDNLVKITTWAASLGTTYTTAGRTFYLAELNAGFTVNAAGTVNIQFAQAVSNGTASSVDHDSFAELIQIN